MNRSSRLATLLLSLGVVLLVLTTIVLVTARGILDPDPFSRRLAASLGRQPVADYVASQITDAMVAQRPNLVALRPILESSVRGVVASEPFRALVRRSARTAHHAMFEAAGQRVVLALPDVSALVRGALSQVSPEMAAKLPPFLETGLGSEQTQHALSLFIRFWQWGTILVRVAWGLWALGILLIFAGVWAAPDRRRMLVHAGGSLAVAGVVLLSVPFAGRILGFVLADEPALRGALVGVWLTYFAPVRWLALIYGGTGLVLASAGTTVMEAVDPLARGRWLWERAFARDAATPVRAARAALALAAAVWAIAAPLQAVAAVAVLAGLVLAYLGLRELFRLLLAYVPGAVVAEQEGHSGRLWIAVAATVLVVVVGLGLAARLALRSGDRAVAAAGAVSTCNGSVALCDYAVNDVVFPGAHNAMSNSDIPGWMFPHHNHGMRRMLDDGIRMLAIDVHYGVPTAGRVRTDFDRESVSVDKIEGEIGPEGTAAAVRIRNQLVGAAEGPSGLYFCHGFCELGAYTVDSTLRQIRDFLVLNPGEVVMLVVEDYVQPLDLMHAFEQAGLTEFVYTGPVRDPWPTLRELIDAGQRLIVFAESGKPGVGWLRPAFATFQETPYSFHRTTDFSCRPNRGGTEGSLFQINHWIETTPAPRPSIADSVNAYDFLLRRARTCERERRHVPNVIAVDFYDIGDVVRVARTLNGQDSTASR